MLFYYLRHGDPTYDPDSLTPLGHRQAEALSHRLALHGLDEIYVSSSTRAIQTAQPTCDLLKKEPIILDWCNENHAWKEQGHLDANGVWVWPFFDTDLIATFATEETRRMGKHWYNDPAFEPYHFGPGMERIERETYAFLASLGYEFDEERGMYRCVAPQDKRVALFAHQGFGLTFLSYLLNIPYPTFCTRFDIAHSSMTVIRFDGTGDYTLPRVLQSSNDSHLYRDGLPTRYSNGLYL